MATACGTLPRPSDCLGIVGVASGILGIVVSIGLLLVLEVVPWGWYLLVAIGTLGGSRGSIVWVGNGNTIRIPDHE